MRRNQAHQARISENILRLLKLSLNIREVGHLDPKCGSLVGKERVDYQGIGEGAHYMQISASLPPPS